MTSIKHSGRQSWLLLVVIIGLVVVIAFPVYLDHNRSLENKRDIRDLACILVSQTPDDAAKPIIHEFRNKYGCPPFTPASLGHLTPQPTPTVTATKTRTVPKPGPTRTVGVPVPSIVTVPGQPVPGPTVTVTRTRTVVRTVPLPGCFKKLVLPPCTLN